MSYHLYLLTSLIAAMLFSIGCAASDLGPVPSPPTPRPPTALPVSLPPISSPTPTPPAPPPAPSPPGHPTALPLLPTPDAQAQAAGAQVEINAHPAAATVGDLITLTGRPTNLGLPQYTLYLRNEPAVVRPGYPGRSKHAFRAAAMMSWL